MTTSSDSSVTRCETCGDEIMKISDNPLAPWAHISGGHKPVPAPAPSTDPASEPCPLHWDTRPEPTCLTCNPSQLGRAVLGRDAIGRVAVPSSIEGDRHMTVGEAFNAYKATELDGIWVLMSIAEREHAEVSFIAGWNAAYRKGVTMTEARSVPDLCQWADPDTGMVCGLTEWPIVRGVAYPGHGRHTPCAELGGGTTWHNNYKCHQFTTVLASPALPEPPVEGVSRCKCGRLWGGATVKEVGSGLPSYPVCRWPVEGGMYGFHRFALPAPALPVEGGACYCGGPAVDTVAGRRLCEEHLPWNTMQPLGAPPLRNISPTIAEISATLTIPPVEGDDSDRVEAAREAVEDALPYDMRTGMLYAVREALDRFERAVSDKSRADERRVAEERIAELGEALKRVFDVAICECVVGMTIETSHDCDVHRIVKEALAWCHECGEFTAVDGHAAACALSKSAQEAQDGD